MRRHHVRTLSLCHLAVIAVMSRVGVRLFLHMHLIHSVPTLQFSSVGVPSWRLKTQHLKVTRATQCCCRLCYRNTKNSHSHLAYTCTPMYQSKFLRLL